MENQDFKSVLTFYQVDDNLIQDMDELEIWNKVILTNYSDVTCRNVFHFVLSTEQLLMDVKSKNISLSLFDDIKSEYELGANLMFVGPIVGNPVGGFFINEYLKSSD